MPSTIAGVTAELVLAGWPRQDPDRRGQHRDLSGPGWWSVELEDGLIEDDGPRQVLTLHHRQGWVCVVAADASDGVIEDLSVWPQGDDQRRQLPLLTACGWPGLAPLLAVVGALLDPMPPAADG